MDQPKISYGLQADAVKAANSDACIKAMRPKPNDAAVEHIRKWLQAAEDTLRELDYKQRMGGGYE